MKIAITKIKGNENNPRILKTDKFKKLVNSIKEFPKMLEIRPIIVDENMMVLGGNMRLKACQKVGLKEVHINKFTKKMADEMNVVARDELRDEKTYEEYCEEFIIKDNVGFGEWDWDLIANQWDDKPLDAWGLDTPDGKDTINPEEQEIEFSEYLEESHNYVVLLFDNDVDWLSAQTHFDLKSVHSKRANGKAWSKGIGRVINGAKYLKNITSE
tara:strand:+ start:104 stop:745 length:642 start_codon:yes stop_codon:yes gene_type:complete